MNVTPDEKKQLIFAAESVKQNAHCPYSKFPVGAALLTQDGQTFTGCNIENASYPVGVCAEKNAVAPAIAKGYKKGDFKAIAVSGNTVEPLSPCGTCRQYLIEFGADWLVIMCDKNGGTIESTVRDLLPHSFGL